MAEAPETRYTTAGGLRVAYEVTGTGPPDLVFVPDWLNNVELAWDLPGAARYLERLASFSRLIVFDKRGTGLSDPVPLDALPTLEDWMDDVRAVSDAVGVERPALMGFGGAGPMCMLYAATHPDRVSALVLHQTCARVRQALDYPEGIPDAVADGFLSFVRERWGTPEWFDLVAPSTVTDRHQQVALARVQRLAASPGAALAMMKMVVEVDVRSVLPTIAVPTLVVHRRDDGVMPVAHARYLAEHIRGARLVEVPGRDYLYNVGDGTPVLDEIQEFLTGVREQAVPDRVLLTVLFTDIGDSTRLASELGDRAWRDVLESHHAAVRRQLERFRGREVDTAGDGFFATFDGPARGIRCAQAILDAVRPLGLSVRAGLHTGECEVIGDKVGGIAVHVGARVVGAARPGEVLVSGTVRDLVAGSGIPFTDRGLHQLKGVPGEWALCAVGEGPP
jgi:pimeloyl-ACP methyl ester carboxylesterase